MRPVPAPDGPPVYPGDFPDPFVLRVGSTYYAYATQTGDVNVQVMQSSDLTTWQYLGEALPTLPSWAGPGRTWAPAILPRDDAYLLYYAVREPASDRQCISLAICEQPEGPFRDTSDEPFIFQLERGGSIDPSPFVDVEGTAYLLWKSDDTAISRPSSIWIQELTPDGLTLTGDASELLRHDREWERPLIEGPAMVRHGDHYYLFYSANWWESEHYAIGYARSRSPLGPFRKITRSRPWLASGNQAAGPGGQELFTEPDGSLRMAFHAWTPGVVGYAAGGKRSLHIACVDLTDGRPRPQGCAQPENEEGRRE